MRRILISKRGEFRYQNDQASSLGYALKKLGSFFDEVERKDNSKKEVAVSSSTLEPAARKVKSR